MKKHYQKLYDLIKQANNIICIRHINCDLDACGSVGSFAQLIQDNFVNKKVYIDGTPCLRLKKLINFTSLEQNYFKNALVIIFDTSVIERIDSNFWNHGKTIVKFDHHLRTNLKSYNFADFDVIDSSAVATTQMITEFAIANKLKISKQAAKLLFLGLIGDSGRFLFPKVNQKTFLCAYNLLKAKINIQNIYNLIYTQKLSLLKLRTIFINKIKVKENVGYIILKPYLVNFYNLTEQIIKQEVNIMSNIKEIKIWFIAYQLSKNSKIKISVRSNLYNIHEVAKKFNGGGHQTACGTFLNKWKQLPFFVFSLQMCIKKNNFIANKN